MKKENKKGSLILLIIKIVLLFLLTDFVISFVPGLMTRAVNTGKYGLNFIVEMFAVLVVFIVMILSKNQYVFTDKKEGFFKSILLGLPILIIAILMFILNSLSIILEFDLNISNLITLILFCISIGLYEEFLCRGWLLNEFLEKYGSTRRQVIVSIFISAIIFGLMHISNIWVGGQTVTETILQIVQATTIGVLFGAVYYRTKNIWAVIFLHAFYDFSIFLGSVNVLKDCHVVEEAVSITTIAGSLMFCGVYLLSSAIILRKSKINHLIEKEKELTPEQKHKSDRMKIIYIVLIIALILFPKPTDDVKVEEICYEYKEKTLKNLEVHYSKYNTYSIEEEYIYTTTEETIIPENPTEQIQVQVEKKIPIKIHFEAKEKELIIKLNDKQETIKFEDPIEIIVLEQPKEYLLLVHEQDEQSGASKIHYSRYLLKETIKDSEEYLKEFTKSLKMEYVPDVIELGYITSRDFEYKYPLLNLGTSNYLYLDENNKIFKIKR